MTDSKETSDQASPSWKWTLPLCIGILLVAGGAVWLIYTTEPEAERTGAMRRSAMLVDVVTVERGDYRPILRVLGEVEPARELVLRARVSGDIKEIAAVFRPGGIVEEGEQLLRINPEDYEITLRQRQSDLDEAKADLALEEGRQLVAREDFKLLENEIPEAQRSLVLREPQMQVARARVQAAEAAVAQARLQLERTQVKAPFPAQVIEREVDLGSQVSLGDALGRMVGLETYWIFATVPVSQLPWLEFASEGAENARAAVVRSRTAWPDGVVRQGRVQSLVGGLTEQTRLARVLIEVDDPLAREMEGVPPLLLGSLVEVEIAGEEIPDVVRLSRDFVRKDDTAWVMEEGELSIRPLEIVFEDSRFVYASKGLNEGDAVVTTSLANISEGAPLRLAGADSNPVDGGKSE